MSHLRSALRTLSAWAPVRRLVESLRARRHRALLERSGLFDHAFYESQVGAPMADPIDDYLHRGAADGLSPHPLFDPEHYLAASSAARRSVAPPYVEFLDVGCHRPLQPHPLFDPVAYLAATPGAERHPHGAFGHFLAQRRAHAPVTAAHAALLPSAVVEPEVYVERAHAAALEAHGRPDTVPPDQESFDHDRAERLVARVRSGTEQRPTPLVSIVLPTRNRRDLVAEAIASVRAQTWGAWELLVVDDGGGDGTHELVADLAGHDDRIRYRWREHGGVAAARNEGLEMAQGDYVAYLDSDNTWEPVFLEVMVGVLQGEGHRAAHAASELDHPDGTRYRSRSVDTATLLARNHVDCIMLVHERALLDEVGTFDESLERFVDWDLLLRMSRVTPLHHVPFIGTRYAVGDAAGHDRLTTTRSIGWRDVVQARHLVDWDPVTSPEPGTASVVLALGGRESLPVDTIDALLKGVHEVVIVDFGLGITEAAALRLVDQVTPSLRVVTPQVRVARSVARVLGCAAATGAVVVLAEPAAELAFEHVERLRRAVARTGGVVAPLLLDEAGLVVGGAVSLVAGGDVVRHGRGCLPDDEAALPQPVDANDEDPVEVEAVEQGVVACAADLLRRLRGPDPLFVSGGGVVDMSLRARSLGGNVGIDASTRVVWTGPAAEVGGSPRGVDREALARRWPGAALAPVAATLTLVDDPGRALPRRWETVGPRSSVRRWVVATCVPDARVAPTWGDWHFALGLRDALAWLGEHALVDTVASRRRRDLARDDVHVLVRGVNPVPPVPGSVNLLWVISHPADVADAELAAADHVFVAGAAAAGDLADRPSRATVEVLLQCTDPSRFHPDVDASGLVRHDQVLFVGNSRGQRRRVLVDAAAAGLEPVVIGQDWEGLVPADWVAAEHVPNQELPALYAAAGVVLNDHWPDMAAGGIVSNRLFDVVAAGGVAVSDRVEGLAEIFGDRVQVYDGPDDLPAAVARARELDRADVSLAGKVGREHSFLARARRLVAVADGLTSGGARTSWGTRSQ